MARRVSITIVGTVVDDRPEAFLVDHVTALAERLFDHLAADVDDLLPELETVEDFYGEVLP